jgi:hypothetical protein
LAAHGSKDRKAAVMVGIIVAMVMEGSWLGGGNKPGKGVKLGIALLEIMGISLEPRANAITSTPEARLRQIWKDEFEHIDACAPALRGVIEGQAVLT